MLIHYAIASCSLGYVLVATTERGICALFLGDDRSRLTAEAKSRFPIAELIRGDDSLGQWIDRAIGLIDKPGQVNALPLDLRGTAFQSCVWEALRQIPAGSTVSYSELARRIGRPTAARAVAQACGANPVAIAVPCHRVVRSDHSLSGYRWGVGRKAELLRRERE